MKQSYNTSYYPPIPALEIRLYSSITDEFAGPFLAVLDTGSDATLVPLAPLLTILPLLLDGVQQQTSLLDDATLSRLRSR